VTKERLPQRGANGISDCQSRLVKPIVFRELDPYFIEVPSHITMIRLSTIKLQ